MIYSVLFKIRDHRGIKPNIKAFLLNLATHYSKENGTIFQGVKTKTLADEMELSQRQVRNLAHESVSSGWIYWDKPTSSWSFTDKLLGKPTSPNGIEIGEAHFPSRGNPLPLEGKPTSPRGEIGEHEVHTKDLYKDFIKDFIKDSGNVVSNSVRDNDSINLMELPIYDETPEYINLVEPTAIAEALGTESWNSSTPNDVNKNFKSSEVSEKNHKFPTTEEEVEEWIRTHQRKSILNPYDSAKPFNSLPIHLKSAIQSGIISDATFQDALSQMKSPVDLNRRLNKLLPEEDEGAD